MTIPKEYRSMRDGCARWAVRCVTRSAALWLLALPAVWAAPAIQSVTSTQQAGTEVVRIEFNEPLATVPAGFAVQTPPRVALDLPESPMPPAAAAWS